MPIYINEINILTSLTDLSLIYVVSVRVMGDTSILIHNAIPIFIIFIHHN